MTFASTGSPFGGGLASPTAHGVEAVMNLEDEDAFKGSPRLRSLSMGAAAKRNSGSASSSPMSRGGGVNSGGADGTKKKRRRRGDSATADLIKIGSVEMPILDAEHDDDGGDEDFFEEEEEECFYYEEEVEEEEQEDDDDDEPYDEGRRVEAMLRKYAPDKIEQVEKLLAQHGGIAGKLLDALVNKYGEEPPPPPPRAKSKKSSNNTAGGKKTKKTIVVVKRGAAAPANSKKESAPPPPRSAETRVEAMLQKYAPEKVADIEQMVARHGGDATKLLESLVKEYGDEPPPPPPQQQQTKKSNTNKKKIDAATGRKMLQRQREEKKKANNDNNSNNQRSSATPAVRVEAMLQKYAPEKLGEMNALIAAEGGDAAKLLESLVKEYGAEPMQKPPKRDDQTEESLREMSDELARDAMSVGVLIRIQALFRKFRTRRAFLQAKAVWSMLDDEEDGEDEMGGDY